MYQSFEVTARPDQGPPRLASLRAEMKARSVDGFLVPRADAHQGEYVAPCDERLAWLTGFTGSAGFAAVLADSAGVFVDGRYRVQVRDQVASEFTAIDWPETSLADWLITNLSAGATVGFDPWLHSIDEHARLSQRLDAAGISLVATDNLVDRIWKDRPAPPKAAAFVQPLELAGEAHDAKRARLAKTLRDNSQSAAVLTLPDSIAWLLNIRGADIPRIPVVQCFAILHEDSRLDLVVIPEKTQSIAAHLGPDVHVVPPQEFAGLLSSLTGSVRVDPASCPVWVADQLAKSDTRTVHAPDPCALPKACKNAVELSGARAAHHRDAVAMVEFLAWLDRTTPKEELSEIDVVTALESFRRQTNALRDISFDTISGAGPNGAIVHYRVTRDSNRSLARNDLLLVDSGGQYVDGTTDITRTVAIGNPPPGARESFTNVLRGMIAVSMARWPRGLTGRDLDPLARAALWRAGQDYDHGTGHGVGSYLSVHEGPQRIARSSDTPLAPGMILSNEPGYYREGAFGIRIENLVAVIPAPDTPPQGDAYRDMLAFETLTWVPIDRRLVLADRLAPDEREWLDAYHAQVARRLNRDLSEDARDWLTSATAPL